MLVRPVQPRKVWESIVEILLEIVTLVRPVLYWNALRPRLVTVFGIVTLVKLGQ